MDATAYAARHVHNPSADPAQPYGQAERDVLSLSEFEVAQREISTWPGYRATPLIDLPGLAAQLGLGGIHYKDEDKRFGLHSFKALGGAYAVLRMLQAHLTDGHGLPDVSSAELLRGAHRELVCNVTVTSATDGNHGRSVAWGAFMFGCRCVIYLHGHVSEAREAEIAGYGAEIVRVEGNYDDSVRQCGEDANRLGRVLVADTTSGGGDTRIPRLVMQGYTVMVQEFMDQMGERPISHVFVPGGVGGIAAAVEAHLWEVLGSARPRIVIVEPAKADCIYRSIEAGALVPVRGDIETVMACLAAGEVSPIAWPILKAASDDVITLGEDAAPETMRLLARGLGGDRAIVSGESGCAAIAGLVAACNDPELASALGLSEASNVVAIGSEGATDAAIYERIVGEAAATVAARA